MAIAVTRHQLDVGEKSRRDQDASTSYGSIADLIMNGVRPVVMLREWASCSLALVCGHAATVTCKLSRRKQPD